MEPPGIRDFLPREKESAGTQNKRSEKRRNKERRGNLMSSIYIYTYTLMSEAFYVKWFLSFTMHGIFLEQ
jgi:hypothetical protein